jgi:hypothetical protein
MRNIRPVRLIRKREAQPAADVPAATRSEPSEREIKTTVSQWVRDHKQRSEDFRRSFASLWQAGELNLNPR